MNPYDLTTPKAFADLELLTAEDVNEYLNHTQLGYNDGGPVPGAGQAAAVALAWVGAYGIFSAAGDGVWLSGVGNSTDLRMVVTTGSDLAVSATGTVAATKIGTIGAAEWRPRQIVPFATTGGARQLAGYISPNGDVMLTHVGGSGTLAKSTVISFAAHYVRRGVA